MIKCSCPKPWQKNIMSLPILNKKNIVWIFLFWLVGVIYSQPTVQDVTGNIQQNATISVSGNGFGSKIPAAPVVWDACTDSVDLGTYYSQWLPTSAQQGPFYNTKYRQVPFRNISAPSPYINYVIGGAHASNTSAGMYISGNNVCVGVNIQSFDFFVQYWYRIDPLFDVENHPTSGDNMKEFSLGNTPSEIYTGLHGFNGWCGSHVPNINFTDPVRLVRIPIDCPPLPYSCSNDQYVVYHLNPINDWVKMQWEGGYNDVYDNPTIKFSTYPDGHVTYQSHYGTEITVNDTYVGCGHPDKDDLRFLGIGGFARLPRMNNGVNSFRYFTAIYIDSVKSRVMIGNNSDYNLCTKVEPQIPVSWNQNAITATVNLGAIQSGESAYLFVFDGTNSHNVIGFNLGSGGNEPPSQPEGVQVTN